jgi:hypothetical protein
MVVASSIDQSPGTNGKEGLMRFKIILFMAGFAVLLLAGCGGGEGTTGGAASAKKDPASAPAADKTASSQGATAKKSTPMNKTEFDVRLNEICIQVPADYKKELKVLNADGKKHSKAEVNLKAAIPPLEMALEQFESVKPPPNEKQVLTQMTAAMETAVKGLKKKPTSELSGPQSPFAEFQTVSTRYGLQTCSGL